jgi:hypothetical protein
LFAKSTVALCCAFFLSAVTGPLLAHGQGGGATVSPSSGKALCSGLTPADFTKAGVAVSGLRQANLDGPTGAYCVYESKAGKVEFDIFFPAGENPSEVLATEKTALGEVGGKAGSVKIAGADDAHIPATTDKTAVIVVRKGKAVFVITIPKTAVARRQLVELAQIAVGRLKQ